MQTGSYFTACRMLWGACFCHAGAIRQNTDSADNFGRVPLAGAPLYVAGALKPAGPACGRTYRCHLYK